MFHKLIIVFDIIQNMFGFNAIPFFSSSSAENLCRDVFLRQNMDQQGWVPISLIAGFNRVSELIIVMFFLSIVHVHA